MGYWSAEMCAFLCCSYRFCLGTCQHANI